MSCIKTFLVAVSACIGLVACGGGQEPGLLASPEQLRVQLTVNRIGSGTVTSSPAGIDCGMQCDTSVVAGTPLTLTAIPATGERFTGWSGSQVSCPGTGACTLTIDAIRTITATFSPAAAQTFDWHLDITGSGTITTDRGDTCSVDCAGQVPAGTLVTFTAAAAMGNTFTGWGGACSGTTATCRVTMNAASSVTAGFAVSGTPGQQGAAYYVDANAANDNGTGSAGSPKKYIGSAAALMSTRGGDTVIVKPGTYGHAQDALRTIPPGKAGAWNTIKAEVDGTVTITAGFDLPVGDHYLQFEGLAWVSNTGKGVTGRYVKILRCAFKGGPLTDNTMNLAIGTNDVTPGAQHILVEDSHVYGLGGRYSVLVYNADKVVLRRVVVRHQPGWSDTKGDPEAGMAIYNSTDVLTQNLVVLDSAGGRNFTSGIYHPSNTRASANIRNTGAMVLNIAGTGIGWDDGATVTGMTLEDSAVVGTTDLGVFVNGGVKNAALKNVTIARTGSHGTAAYGSNTPANFSISDSVVTRFGGEQFKNGITATNVSSTLPSWPTRPVGSTGATILKRLGKSGTLWGEAGYDQPQAENLWPFPNEVAIKTSMCADAGVTTGFCNSPSLTHYVWEQFGTPLPASFDPP